MPGRRRTNYRAGDLAEDLGILLLKGIAAVAEVDREEDVGVDAVATLLRRDADGNSYAEESFCVQVKAASTSEVSFTGHELEWFASQQLPMFFGLVSLNDQSLSLYSTIYALQAIRFLRNPTLLLRFGQSTLPAFLAGHRRSPWTSENPETTVVWLDNPVAKWSVADLQDREKLGLFYRTVKEFVQLATSDLRHSELKQSLLTAWETNVPVGNNCLPQVAVWGLDDAEATIDRCKLAMRFLLSFGLNAGSKGNFAIVDGLNLIGRGLRAEGIELRPDELPLDFAELVRQAYADRNTME